MTHLDHDHCERENIRFFAVRPLLAQDLRRGPSRGVTPITQGTPYGVLILSDHSKTEIRDLCTTGGIHKDVRLAECQGGRTIFGTITYSLEISMNHVAGVEIVKAIDDIT